MECQCTLQMGIHLTNSWLGRIVRNKYTHSNKHQQDSSLCHLTGILESATTQEKYQLH